MHLPALNPEPAWMPNTERPDYQEARDVGEQVGRAYYASRKAEILAVFDDHAQAWRPLLVSRYGDDFADVILREAREQHATLIPELPGIGGDDNPMTRHLIRSTTSLVLYLAMRRRGKTAQETGRIVYDAVVERVSHLPAPAPRDLTPEAVAREMEQARRSQERRYPGDWVWEFVEGDGKAFDYGYDFVECGAEKLYRALGAGEFLPFYCFLDFVTHRTPEWGFARTMTLAKGHERCDFRYKRGGKTERGWPPPFVKARGDG